MDPHNKNRECINEFWKQSYRKFYVPLKKMDSGEEQGDKKCVPQSR